MLRDLGRRFGRPPEPAAPAAPIVEPRPLVDIVAYTDQAILRGTIALEADRLTDALNATDVIVLEVVAVEHLADGSTMQLPSLRVARDDIAAIQATGPRGDPARRVRTQAQPVVIRSGPYQIDGRVHALAGADPVGSLRRRRPMIPLTAAHISFTAGGQPQTVAADLLIINRDLIDVVDGPPEAPDVSPPVPGTATPPAG